MKFFWDASGPGRPLIWVKDAPLYFLALQAMGRKFRAPVPDVRLDILPDVRGINHAKTFSMGRSWLMCLLPCLKLRCFTCLQGILRIVTLWSLSVTSSEFARLSTTLHDFWFLIALHARRTAFPISTRFCGIGHQGRQRDYKELVR